MVDFVEEVGRRRGVEHPIQMTIGTSDGKSVWAFRYSSERDSRTLFYSTDVRTVRELHPELAILQAVSDESRIIVSEPLGNLRGAWNEVPESSYGVVQEGADELRRTSRASPSGRWRNVPQPRSRTPLRGPSRAT
jgi:glutamine amidotransferase